MAVTRKLHPLLLEELQIVLRRVALGNDLTALEHAVRQRLEVAATDHEYTWVRCDSNLHHLEVVREVSAELDELMLNVARRRVVGCDGLRVLLEDAKSLREFDPLRQCLVRRDASVHFTHDGLPALIRRSLLHCELCLHIYISVELTTLRRHLLGGIAVLHMIDYLVVHEGFVTARAHHLNDLHEILDLSVYLLEPRVLAALRTAHESLITGAFAAEQHLASLVTAFPAIVKHHTGAVGAQEETGHSENTRRLKRVLGGHYGLHVDNNYNSH